MAEYDWVRATDRCRRQVMSLQEADEFLSRSAERLASLQAERDAFALLLSDAETERDMALSRNAEVEAQLALRDAVVEAARRRCDLLRWAAADHDPVKPRPFDDTRSFADHLRQADADMNDALAALDASENPRGATP